MPQVCFIEKGSARLMGDSRAIIVDSAVRQQAWNWATGNGISIEYQGTLSGKDLWYVKNDQHRSWFLLRWAHG
jgi:hypothetical protein